MPTSRAFLLACATAATLGLSVFFLDAVGPQGRPWMWASVTGDIRRAASGYEPTREAAMAAFAKSWRGDSR
jgi:hypothetical protein